MTHTGIHDDAVASTAKRYSLISKALLTMSASGVLVGIILAFLNVDVSSRDAPVWLKVVMYGWIFTPPVIAAFVHIERRTAISRSSADVSTFVPEEKSFRFGSSVATKYKANGSRAVPVPELVFILLVVAFVFFGGNMMNWVIDTGASFDALNGVLIGFGSLMALLLLWMVFRSVKNEKLLRRFRKDVRTSLAVHGYEWGDDSYDIVPGNVYTAQHPALLKDSEGRFSKWSIVWDGEFASATWLEPEKQNAE